MTDSSAEFVVDVLPEVAPAVQQPPLPPIVEPAVVKRKQPQANAAKKPSVAVVVPKKPKLQGLLWACLNYKAPLPFAACSLVITKPSSAPRSILVERVRAMHGEEAVIEDLCFHIVDLTRERAYWLVDSEFNDEVEEDVVTTATTQPNHCFLWTRSANVYPFGISMLVIASSIDHAKTLASRRLGKDRTLNDYSLEDFLCLQIDLTSAHDTAYLLEFGETPPAVVTTN
jgi:hypothetical protein